MGWSKRKGRGASVRTEISREDALERAQKGESLTNYPAIYSGFAAKGIPSSEILPRVNIFTFNAWLAKGRVVKKGEKGVKVVTFIETEKRDATTGAITKHRVPKTTTVFHERQTQLIGATDARIERAAAYEKGATV